MVHPVAQFGGALVDREKRKGFDDPDTSQDWIIGLAPCESDISSRVIAEAISISSEDRITNALIE
jgi:hypothetical protein